MRPTAIVSAIAIISAILLLGARLKPVVLRLPDADGGIGLDDLKFSSSLGRLLVPAGRTGKLDLIDPSSLQLEEVRGFTRTSRYRGGHDVGVTSADDGDGLVFATDRSAKLLAVIDPRSKKIVASTSLVSSPDYVRFVNSNDEVWVTEPDTEHIQVFKLGSADLPRLVPAGAFAVRGGPESLVIDDAGRHAYTNLWTHSTVAIDLRSHEPVARWPNGCRESRGLALDASRKFLFVACAEGKLSVLSANSGRQLGSISSGAGVDIIAYSSKLHHVYLPGAQSATLAIIEISHAGVPRLMTTMVTVAGAHCVAADPHAKVYVCDPNRGQLLIFSDPVHTGTADGRY